MTLTPESSNEIWSTVTFPPREASVVELEYGRAFEFAVAVLKLPLEPDRPVWTNYAAALGAAAIKAASTLWLLVRIDQSQGAATMAREVVELTARFIHCLENEKASLDLAIYHEHCQIENVKENQSIGHYWVNGHEALIAIEAKMKELQVPLITKGRPKADTKYVGAMKESYGLLSLGAHSRPSAVMERYRSHLVTNLIDLMEVQPRSYSDDYVKMAGNALYEGCRAYIESKCFPTNMRASSEQALQEAFGTFIVPLKTANT